MGAGIWYLQEAEIPLKREWEGKVLSFFFFFLCLVAIQLQK